MGSRKGASLFVGALLGGLLPEDLEGHREEGSWDGHHSPWGTRWGIWLGACLLGLAKALETSTFLHRGLVKYHGGVCSPGTPRDN